MCQTKCVKLTKWIEGAFCDARRGVVIVLNLKNGVLLRGFRANRQDKL